MNTKPISIVFFGSPEFAVPSLEILSKDPQVKILAVVTQAEKTRSRGNKSETTPVGTAAALLNIPVFSPNSLKNKDAEAIRFDNFIKYSGRPDFCALVAYGRLIPKEYLELPVLSFLNVHPSALPKWRGAAPIQHTILSGEKETEVCIIELIEALDAGPIYLNKIISISREENYDELSKRLSEIGASLLHTTIIQITRGETKATPQKASGESYANKISKDDLIINWTNQAEKIHNQVRAYSHSPGARSFLNSRLCKIIKTLILENQNLENQINKSPGTISTQQKDSKIFVSCGESSAIEILELQLEGKGIVSAKEFLNGHQNLDQMKFTNTK